MAGKTNLQRNSLIRRRGSAVCVEQGRVLMVRLKDPYSGVSFLSPPGGLVEEGESPLSTAIRETMEETGYHVRPCFGVSPEIVTYDFEWNGAINNCETTFFLCELSTPLRDPLSDREPGYVIGPEWVELDRVCEALDFHAVVRDAVLKLLRR